MKRARVTFADGSYRDFENLLRVDVEEMQKYVQVRFLPFTGDPSLWTYVDPTLSLRVGDVVDVPTRYNQHNLAVVEKLGDGSNGMNIHKKVAFRYYNMSDSPGINYRPRFRASGNYTY